MSFLKQVFLVLLVLSLTSGLPSLGCEEDCLSGGAADCTDPLCSGCYSDLGEALCGTCCDVNNNVSLAACTSIPGCVYEWSSISGVSECRNESGVDCTGLPEVPAKSRAWLLIGFSVAALGLAGALKFKKRKTV